MDVKLVSELQKNGYVPYPVRPDGFGITVEEYSEQNNCSRDMARNLLNSAVTAGILASHLVRGNGGKTMVYHRPGDWPPPA